MGKTIILNAVVLISLAFSSSVSAICNIAPDVAILITWTNPDGGYEARATPRTPDHGDAPHHEFAPHGWKREQAAINNEIHADKESVNFVCTLYRDRLMDAWPPKTESMPIKVYQFDHRTRRTGTGLLIEYPGVFKSP